MNYKTLRHIQQQEHSSPGFSKLEPEFYTLLNKYIKLLETESTKEEHSQKQQIIQEEIQKIKKISVNIYELREKKIVQAALSTVRGARPDLKNLLENELALYTNLVEQITEVRKIILEEQPIAPQSSTPSLSQSSQQPSTHQIPPETKHPPNKNPIVRVLEDTPDFVGTDLKTYSLKKEDVLTIPPEMSVPLQKRGVIHPIT